MARSRLNDVSTAKTSRPSGLVRVASSNAPAPATRRPDCPVCQNETTAATPAVTRKAKSGVSMPLMATWQRARRRPAAARAKRPGARIRPIYVEPTRTPRRGCRGRRATRDLREDDDVQTRPDGGRAHHHPEKIGVPFNGRFTRVPEQARTRRRLAANRNEMYESSATHCSHRACRMRMAAGTPAQVPSQIPARRTGGRLGCGRRLVKRPRRRTDICGCGRQEKRNYRRNSGEAASVCRLPAAPGVTLAEGQLFRTTWRILRTVIHSSTRLADRTFGSPTPGKSRGRLARQKIPATC